MTVTSFYPQLPWRKLYVNFRHVGIKVSLTIGFTWSRSTRPLVFTANKSKHVRQVVPARALLVHAASVRLKRAHLFKPAQDRANHLEQTKGDNEPRGFWRHPLEWNGSFQFPGAKSYSRKAYKLTWNYRNFELINKCLQSHE